jgi:hypothetical protein
VIFRQILLEAKEWAGNTEEYAQNKQGQEILGVKSERGYAI